MIYKIMANEWLQWGRDKHLKWISIFLLVISVTALWHQLDFQTKLQKTRIKAQEDARREWLSQELKHPHIAAHFGNYAYKKPSLLHCFDPGLSIYTGTSVYMEPHRQNDFLFSKSQETDTGLRFGWLSPALVCQLLLPLLIIILSFNSINGEYEKGTMSLLQAQGASFRQILLAKTGAVFLVFELFITIYLLVTCVAAWVLLKTTVDVAALGYIWIVYSFYNLIWCLAGVFISSRIKTAGGSIATLLLLWICTSMLMPRVAANIAENVYPLHTNYVFRQQIAAAIEKGLDGHDPQSSRAKKIEQELLARYKVDSVQQLPFNFEGYIMQQSEEYSSRVYDNYFGEIFTSLKQQKKLQAWLGMLSPFIAVRNISMAACNASVESEIDFQQQAEQYRRSFVQNMNNDMRDHSAYGSFNTYKVKEETYENTRDVEIKTHTLGWSLPHILLENIGLFLWLLVLTVMICRIKY